MVANRARYPLGLAVVAFVLPVTAFATGFPIANSANPEYSADAAFDGTNFLVSVQESSADPAGTRTTGARLLSPSGAVLASVTAPIGDAPLIAFDGTNYLLAWADYSNTLNPYVRGLRVDKQGVAMGSSFVLSQSITVRQMDGLAFDGTNYLAVWTDQGLTNTDVYARFISTTGTPVGSDFKVSGAAGNDGSVAFAAPNHLVVWTENTAGQEVHGRFVSPAGTMGSEFTVNASPAMSHNPKKVATDGTNFFVVWSDQVAAENLDFFAQLVSPSGALLGATIPITTAAGVQFFPYIAYDGVNYLVTWTDLQNDADGNFACDPGEGLCADVAGQLVSAAGALVGANFAVTADTGNQGQSPTAFGAGRYLVVFTTEFDLENSDVAGTFVASDGIFSNGFENGM
jgi:large repetitive protein